MPPPSPARPAPPRLAVSGTNTPATIHVQWRRTVNVKPYESEVYELGFTDTVLLPADPTARLAAMRQKEHAIFQELASLGDELVAQRGPTA